MGMIDMNGSVRRRWYTRPHQIAIDGLEGLSPEAQIAKFEEIRAEFFPFRLHSQNLYQIILDYQTRDSSIYIFQNVPNLELISGVDIHGVTLPPVLNVDVDGLGIMLPYVANEFKNNTLLDELLAKKKIKISGSGFISYKLMQMMFEDVLTPDESIEDELERELNIIQRQQQWIRIVKNIVHGQQEARKIIISYFRVYFHRFHKETQRELRRNMVFPVILEEMNPWTPKKIFDLNDVRFGDEILCELFEHYGDGFLKLKLGEDAQENAANFMLLVDNLGLVSARQIDLITYMFKDKQIPAFNSEQFSRLCDDVQYVFIKQWYYALLKKKDQAIYALDSSLHGLTLNAMKEAVSKWFPQDHACIDALCGISTQMLQEGTSCDDIIYYLKLYSPEKLSYGSEILTLERSLVKVT